LSFGLLKAVARRLRCLVIVETNRTDTISHGGDAMMRARRITRRLSDAGLTVAIGDAYAAADAAARIAANTASWASRAGAGPEDAAEASRCAMRARMAAGQAEHCLDATEAWSCARLAWATVNSAIEASARLNAAIAENLTRL
jgi:hypothetical protein